MTALPPPAGRHDQFRGSCRSCRAGIFWAHTETGERMPVNEKPAEHGNVVLRIEPAEGGKPERLVASVLNRGQAAGAHADGVTLYQSHFVDCPDAARHRRSGSKTRRWRRT